MEKAAMTSEVVSCTLFLMSRFSSYSRNGITGVTMPYVNPSENIATHIVKSIRALEFLKALKFDMEKMKKYIEKFVRLMI